MTSPGKDNDIDRLLAEVESSLQPGASQRPKPAVPADQVRGTTAGRVTRRVRLAAISGAAAALVIWGIFAMLPVLGATSGAVGAGLATFVAVLLLRRR